MAMQTDPAQPRIANWYPVVDPVCGRQVEPVPIAYHLAHGSDDYYFCSTHCAERFRANPDAYVQRHALILRAQLSPG